MLESRTFRVLFALLALTFPTTTAGAEETRLLRFPDLHGDQVAFTYAGDLWVAPSTGGTARRLTTHPGLELFPKFSPDGDWIAFTGQYDGDEQVYVVPTAGGEPEQLTFYPATGPLPPRWGYDNQVYEWSPDGTQVLFRSLRDGWDLADTQLFTVARDGGLPTALPMPESGGGDLSADGRRAVYSPVTRDFRHWKRYQGGWAQDLFVFDLESHATEQITDHPRTDRDPMWIGDTIYFSSDRTGTLNLFAYDLNSKATRQLTDSSLWDIRWPSADKSAGRIVFERNGGLEILDTASGGTEAIRVHVPTDALAMRPSRVSAMGAISDSGLSPKAERVVFAARGDIFTVPVENGVTRNLTASSSAHDREPAWSPDGSRIAYVSDADGEEEIWIVSQSGGTPDQLTDGSIGRYYDLDWSPDGRHLAYRNQKQQLFVLDTESRDVTTVADDGTSFGLDYAWSPKGGYIALSLAEESGQRSLWIWTVADRIAKQVTDPMFNEYSPSWDPSGDYLFYLSDREFRPQLGSFEFNYAVNRETLIYALALREDVAHPFPPRNDEVTIDEKTEDDSSEDQADEADKDEADKDDEGQDDDGDGDAPLTIDFEGLGHRVTRVPIPAANVFGLAAVEGQLLYVLGPAAYYGRSPDSQFSLHAFSLEDRESTELVPSLQDLSLSADGKKLLVDVGGSYQVMGLSPGSGKPVSTRGLAVDRVPAEEWTQIFDEVWRRFRDFFYVDNMHGYDWQALREQYRPWLEHVAHRSDLNYLISEMIGELAVGHAYITGGDYVQPDRPRSALLGARFALDEASGRYRISRIFAGHNEETNYRSPLTEVGTGVEVGDYLLAINGQRLDADDNPFALLRHAGGDVLELRVGDTPDDEAARTVLVEPIRNEDDLIYLGWIEGRRQRVTELSEGKIGYLHLPNMGTAGLREFIKWFYGQIRKDAMIIDVRSNGGGNVSSMIIERLRRELLMMDFERHQEIPDTYPGAVFHGHLACLIDEDTASDGDQFAYVFKRAGLGPLIGKRTWGGVVGIYGRSGLIDGGGLSVPEAGTADPEGRWVIEGHGVDPDIVVEQDPKAVIEGNDPQLERAVEVLLEKIASEPLELPARPAPPIKTD